MTARPPTSSHPAAPAPAGRSAALRHQLLDAAMQAHAAGRPAGRSAALRHQLLGLPAKALPHPHSAGLARPATLRLALRKPVPKPIPPTSSATLRIAAPGVPGLTDAAEPLPGIAPTPSSAVPQVPSALTVESVSSRTRLPDPAQIPFEAGYTVGSSETAALPSTTYYERGRWPFVTVRAGRGGQGPPVPGLRRRHRTLALDRRSPARSATAHSSPAAFLEARRLRRCPVGRLRLEVAVARLGCDHDVADLPEQAKRPHGAQQRRQALRHSSPKACAAPCAGRGQPIGGVSMACRERPRCWERLALGRGTGAARIARGIWCTTARGSASRLTHGMIQSSPRPLAVRLGRAVTASLAGGAGGTPRAGHAQ